MLSILIPIFNFDVRPLVYELDRQARNLNVPYEICCFDDSSDREWKEQNRELAKLNAVIYREMPQNLGRSRIRNVLGEAARFTYLLFLDCDSEVITSDFLKAYLQQVRSDMVLVGKRVYTSNPPADKTLHLRWLYGIRREQKPASARNRTPYHAFCTAHFLCPRELFLQIRFDESLDQYGHEDTQFGFDLQQNHIPILHIDVPLRHIDLEPADVFLRKSRQAIDNLVFLKQKGSAVETRLLQYYQKIQGWKIQSSLSWIYRAFHPLLERQLLSRAPSLRLFDLYKLTYLAYKMQVA